MTIETELPAVKVKALEWELDSLGRNMARTLCGRYFTIDSKVMSAAWKKPPEINEWVNVGSLDEAKAACQADYEQRVLSALTLKDDPGNGEDDEVTALRARCEKAEALTDTSVTVGGGLSVYGSIDAIMRVQDYILLDSTHPVEKEDVRRSLARDLQAAERRIAELEAALRDKFCPRPCNHRPDEFGVGDCVDAGECGCGALQALIPGGVG